MKKVLTFLFAFAMFGIVAFGQSRAEMSEKAGSVVQEMTKNLNLTSTQQQQVTEVMTDAFMDINSKRDVSATDRATYTAYKESRMSQAFDAMSDFLNEQQLQGVKKSATEMGFLPEAQK